MSSCPNARLDPFRRDRETIAQLRDVRRVAMEDCAARIALRLDGILERLGASIVAHERELERINALANAH